MIEPGSLEALAVEVQQCIKADQPLLDKMRHDIRRLRGETRRIHPRSATAISLVGTDGGNNRLRFDPFFLQLIRVVDSNREEHCLEAISPTTPIDTLNARHLSRAGKGLTPLGRLLEFLGKKGLQELSPVFNKRDEDRASSWVQVYRDMMEWAILFSLIREHEFASDTVIVRDGFLRAKMFASGLFGRIQEGIAEGVEDSFRRARRRKYVVGIARRSNVLQKYRLAMALEGIMRNTYSCFALVPIEIETSVYEWSEYATGGSAGESFVAGQMFLVKFGDRTHDPVWAIDLLKTQISDAATVFGYLLADAVNGFPIPFYPQCLQRAQESATLIDLDLDILQDKVTDALRHELRDKKAIIDDLALQAADVTTGS